MTERADGRYPTPDSVVKAHRSMVVPEQWVDLRETTAIPHAHDARPAREYTLRDFGYAVFEHKGLALLMVAVFLGLAAAYVVMQPNKYVSEALIYLSDPRPNLTLNPTGTESLVRENSQSGIRPERTEISLLGSAELANAVIDKLGPNSILGSDSSTTSFSAAPNAFLDHVKACFRIERQALTEHELALEKLRRGLAVDETMTGSNVVSVKYTDESPERARGTLEAFLESYLDQHIAMHRTQLPPTFFKRQAEIIHERLQEKETTLSQLRDQYDVTALVRQQELALERISELEALIVESRAAIRGFDAEVSTADGRFEDLEPESDSESPPSAVPSNLLPQLLELRNRERELSAKYTDKMPELQLVRQQLKDAEQLLKELEVSPVVSGSATGSVQMELQLQRETAALHRDSEKARLGTLENELAEARAALIRLNSGEQALRLAEREVGTLEREYQQYLNSLQAANISAQLDQDKISNARVLQHATLPAESSKSLPRSAAILFLGLVSGLLAASAAAVVRAASDHSIKTCEDVEYYIGLPVLACIPHHNNFHSQLQNKLENP